MFSYKVWGPPDQATMTTESVLDLPAMRAASNRACALMRVMSNPDRLLLLCQLSQGERRVGELEELLDIQQPTLSQQLAVLRDESLVTTRRDGKQIYYSIDSRAALDVLNVLYTHFCAEQANVR
jgi:DNA-binding transcriptional ArsR family regulator